MTTAAVMSEAREAQPAVPPVNRWLVTASISLGAVMSTIDASIVNVALPQIRGSVGASVQEITWISTGYAIALVMVMPLTAFLGRWVGQKRLYLFCLVLFLAGSVLCGLAGTLTTLVMARVIQGIGGGALQPTQQAILRQTFPPKEQGMAMALFGMAVMIGPAVGPTLGGYIVDHWHWSWIFFINVPIGALGFFMVNSFVHEDPAVHAANRALAERERKNVDWFGIALLSIGLSTFVYFLEEGARDDWFRSKWITACFLVSIISLITFVVHELTTPTPAVNLRLFRDPRFASGTVIGGLQMAILMANMFLLPVFMQELLGYSALQSGMAMVPRVAVMMVMMPIVGRLYSRVSPRLLVAVGIVIFAVSALQQSRLTLQSGWLDIISPIMLQGVGFACLFVPLTTVALSTIPRHKLADASGLNSLVRQLGGAVGLAVFATLLDSYGKVARAAIAVHVTEVDPAVQLRLAMLRRSLAAHGVGASHGALRALHGAVLQQATVLAFDKAFLLAGILFLTVLPALLFLKTDRSAEPVHVEVEVEG